MSKSKLNFPFERFIIAIDLHGQNALLLPVPMMRRSEPSEPRQSKNIQDLQVPDFRGGGLVVLPRRINGKERD